MADVIRTAQYFKVQIADKPGTLSGVLAPLREAGGEFDGRACVSSESPHTGGCGAGRSHRVQGHSEGE